MEITQDPQFKIKASFIKKYELFRLLNHDPLYTILLSESQEYIPDLSIKRFTYNIHKEEGYFSAFIELFKKFLDRYNATDHLNNLLFLSLLYKIDFRNKSAYNARHKSLRDKASILYDLIEVPVFNITLDEACKNLLEEGVEKDEIDQVILGYLNVVSQKPVSDFTNDNGKLDMRKVTKEQKVGVIHMIAESQALSVEMPNGKYLYVSGSIKPSLQYTLAGKKTMITVDYPEKLLSSLVTDLLEVQKENQTLFYQSLLGYDFLTQKDLPKLKKTVNHYGKSSFHAFLIRRIRSLLLAYLDEEKVLDHISKDNRARKKDDFIYEYLTFFGLVNAKIETYRSIETLNSKLLLFNEKLKKDPDFSRTYFSDALKNIPDSETTNDNPHWIQIVDF